MSRDGFEATFHLRVERDAVWKQLTQCGPEVDDGHVWLAGFDSLATIVEAEEPHRLRATKDEEPCAGTDIVITLENEDAGTRVHVVQSRFGDWLAAGYEAMSIGWRHIVADLYTYLATGVHVQRHLRPWGDFGASATGEDGGVRIERVRPGGLADELGIVDGDLLVALAGAPVSNLDDLVTILRVLGAARPSAEWIRGGELMSA